MRLTEAQTEILKGMKSEIKVCDPCLQKFSKSFERKNSIGAKRDAKAKALKAERAKD